MPRCNAGTWEVGQGLDPNFSIDLAGKRVLVTGGAGFVGSALVKRLVAMKADVHVVDNLSRGSMNNLKGPAGGPLIPDDHFHLADLTIYSLCLEIITGYDLVYHLADIVGGCGFVFDHEAYVYRQNIMINSNVLAACLTNKIKSYVYVGTACSWPLHLQMDKSKITSLHEDQTYPALPESSYGWSKLMGEYEAEHALKSGKCNVGVLRFHNVYGPGSGYDPKDSQFLPAITRRAILLEHGQDLSVWGSGNQYRDFVYIDDIVDALVLLAERGMNKGVIQVGSARATRVKEAAQIIVELTKEILNKDLQVFFDMTKPEGDFGRIANNERSSSVLGWQPQIPIKEGLRRSYKWVLRAMERDRLLAKAEMVMSTPDSRGTLLVVGGAGYLGSAVVTRALRDTNLNVRVFDRLVYGGDSTSVLPHYASYPDRFQFISGDLRSYDLDELVRDCDFVLNAAAVVGQHVCKQYPAHAVAINEHAAKRLAEACARAGVKRYIYSSQCSNYANNDTATTSTASMDANVKLSDEDAPLLSPSASDVSLYAATKIRHEQLVLATAAVGSSSAEAALAEMPVTVLRFATFFGLSAAVRFDIILHDMIRDAWRTRVVNVHGPESWRPMVHVDDAARSVVHVLQQHMNLATKCVYNVGSSRQNYRKIDLAMAVGARLDAKIMVVPTESDQRSYRVDFSRFQEATGFVCHKRAEDSIGQLCTALERNVLTDKQLAVAVAVETLDDASGSGGASASKTVPRSRM